MRHPDVGISLVLLAIFAALFVYSFFMPSPRMTLGVGPAFTPRLALLAMMALSLLLLVQGWMKSRRGEAPPAKREPGVRHLYGMAAALGFMLMVDYVGTFASVALYVAVTVWLAGGRRPLTVAAMAVGVPLAVYLLFTRFLEVQFPADWLF